MRPDFDRRDAAREEVFFRTRATTQAGDVIQLQIVNMSAGGFMARCEAELAAGESVSIRLPVVGDISAEIRWSLGGRVGCQFDRMIDLAPYLQLLAEMVEGSR